MPRAERKKSSRARTDKEQARKEKELNMALAEKRVERIIPLLNGAPYAENKTHTSLQIGDITFVLDRKVWVRPGESVSAGSVIQIDCGGAINDLGRDGIGLAEISGKLEYILLPDQQGAMVPVNEAKIAEAKSAGERPPKPIYAEDSEWRVVNAHPSDEDDDTHRIKASAYLGRIVNVIPKLPDAKAE